MGQPKKINLAQVMAESDEDFEKASQRSSYEFQKLQKQRIDPSKSSKHDELLNKTKKFRNVSKPRNQPEQ